MATRIVWDDDVSLDPEPLVKNPVPPPEPSDRDIELMDAAAFKAYKLAKAGAKASPRMPYPVTREMLEWADINDLVAELNKRGMVVTARTSVYMPATTATSPYVPTVTTTSGTYTISGGLGTLSSGMSSGMYQQLLGAVGAVKSGK